MLPLVSMVSLLSVSQLVMETSASLVAGINTTLLIIVIKLQRSYIGNISLYFYFSTPMSKLSNTYETIRRFSTTHVCVCFECFGPLPTSPSQRVGINGAI